MSHLNVTFKYNNKLSMDISDKLNNSMVMYSLPPDFDPEAFERGMDLIITCYNECKEMEQNGGAKSRSTTVKTTATTARGISRIFSPKTKAAFTRVIRGVLRTGTGLSADIITVGAGGDVVVNSVFAIESSLTFINNLNNFIHAMIGAKELFNKLARIDRSKTIPLVSRLKLDDGLQTFEYQFEVIISDHVNTYGTGMLDEIHQGILNIIDKITTTVSDWIACLFPDTAGLAGEIAKTVLDYVVQNGFTYIYNLISILPDNMQKMITNSFALKKLIRHSVKFLRNLIKNMDPQQMTQLVQALGLKASDLVSNPLLKGALNIGTTVASDVLSVGVKAFNASSKFSSTLSFLPTAQSMIVYIIDRYITPNISKGVNLFNQLFPLFLMFTLFIEKYPLIVSGQLIPNPPTTPALESNDEEPTIIEEKTMITGPAIEEQRTTTSATKRRTITPSSRETEIIPDVKNQTETITVDTAQSPAPSIIQQYFDRGLLSPTYQSDERETVKNKQKLRASKQQTTKRKSTGNKTKTTTESKLTTSTPTTPTSNKRQRKKERRQSQPRKKTTQEEVNLSDYNIFAEPESEKNVTTSTTTITSPTSEGLGKTSRAERRAQRRSQKREELKSGKQTTETTPTTKAQRRVQQTIPKDTETITNTTSPTTSENLGKTTRAERRAKSRAQKKASKQTTTHTTHTTTSHPTIHPTTHTTTTHTTTHPTTTHPTTHVVSPTKQRYSSKKRTTYSRKRKYSHFFEMY
ncbi:putative ORFan [Tupanvirus deep ocean]|uniref:ORFan n=2 Tax=Tupanvirus TaxID=2094720 RepID=A0AC62A9D2_9VIRU|nr:putative ORFan [Tupanvirus deep ocean]QKU34260.1 putative ORFan [Tupanvirus deep ocean]